MDKVLFTPNNKNLFVYLQIILITKMYPRTSKHHRFSRGLVLLQSAYVICKGILGNATPTNVILVSLQMVLSDQSLISCEQPPVLFTREPKYIISETTLSSLLLVS